MQRSQSHLKPDCLSVGVQSSWFKNKVAYGAGLIMLSSLYVGAQPVYAQINVNSTQKTKNLYNWIKNLKNRSDNRIISGQHVGPNTAGQYVSTLNDVYWGLNNTTGKEVAMISSDMGEYAADFNELQNTLAWHGYGNSNIVMLSCHSKNPWTGGGYRDRTNGNLRELLPGGAQRSAWETELNRIAGHLTFFRDKGVPVLWRPLHEMNGEWFWWGKRDQAAYKDLWKDMYDYFTNKKGLNNLIWVYSPSNRESWCSTYDAYYPGPEFVDIVGADVYRDDAVILDYDQLKAFGKPMFYTEFGPASSDGSYNYWNLADKIRYSYPEVCGWVSWNDWNNGDGTWSKKSIKYNNHGWVQYHDWVINRDEVNYNQVNLAANNSFDAETYDTQTPSNWLEWSDNNSLNASYTESYGGTKSGARHGTHWKSSAYRVYTYQYQGGLSNGLYTLRCWIKSSGGQSECWLEAKDFGGTPRKVNITASGSYQLLEIKDINVTNGKCIFGIWSSASANQWCHFDDFEFFKQ